MKDVKLFINEYRNKYDEKALSYKAGEICEDGDITNQQLGAEETFSIGMPVYDKDEIELGKLSIGLLKNLDYHTPGLNIKIPVHTWRIDGYTSPHLIVGTSSERKMLAQQ